MFKGNAQIQFLTLVFPVHSAYTQLNREAGFLELEVAAGTL